MDRNFSDLPDNVDVVIFGTDITQSLLAAGCARNGMSVLHIDRNDFYGDKSSVYTLNGIEELYDSLITPHCNGVDSVEGSVVADDNEEVIYLVTKDIESPNILLKDFPCCVSAVSTTHTNNPQDASLQAAGSTEADSPCEPSGLPPSGVANVPLVAAPDHFTKDSLIAASRRFNIDLSPNLVFSTGKTVELLISSDVARYVEFKKISKLYVYNSEYFENVPCSRADVFSDTRLSLIEKRLLMRLFTTALGNERNVPESVLFIDYLRDNCRLPERLVYFILHAIAMTTEKCTTLEGLSRTSNFLKSCSVYGPTPFLWPMYGSAEFPQAFCRLAAVYGAVYVLRSAPIAVIKEKNQDRIKAVVLENGKRVACRFLAMSSSYCPPSLLSKVMTVSEPLGFGLTMRAALLSNQSLFPVDSTQELKPVVYARVPKANFTVSVIELPDHTMACPSGTYLHHFTAPLKCLEKQIPSIEEHQAQLDEFNQLLQSLFCFQNPDSNVDQPTANKPLVYWRLIFSKPVFIVDKTTGELQANDFAVLENTFVLPDAMSNDSGLDYDMSIEIAKQVFRVIKPDAEEFIPKMPRPPVSEDVIGDDVISASEPTEAEQEPSSGASPSGVAQNIVQDQQQNEPDPQ